MLGAAALRAPRLAAALPAVVQPDEPTVVERGLAALSGRLAPPLWDWPPLSGYVYAAAAGVARLAAADVTSDVGARYLLGRVLFLAIALGTVALTGLLGARLADDSRLGVFTGVWAAAVLAVSYTSVRLSRQAHPEHLQLACVLASVLCALAFGRGRRGAPLGAAGLLAGVAGAVKYLGVTAAVVPLVAVLVWRAPARVKAGQLAVLTVTTVVGFVGGTLGTVLDAEAVRGFAWQVAHQTGGHLGYEAAGPGWWFHLGSTLPGTWGWPVTLLGLAGAVVVCVRGTRPQRLVAVLALVLLGLIGLSQVRFPHYALIVQPPLASLAIVALTRIRPRPARIAVAVAVAGSLGLVALHDVRLVRAEAAPSTRLLADATVAELGGPVWTENYTLTTPRDRALVAFGTAPEVLDCRCVAVLSSYQEERYRRLPDRYAAEIAVYDALRRRGRTLAEIRPARPLSYRWDLLPQWGVATIPLTGPVGPVGPTITVLDLRP